MIEEAWKWLGQNEGPVNAVSALIFGASSVVVAVVALRISYRENFGWKPLVIVRGYGGGGGGASNKNYHNAEVQVWNRHKYPIVVHTMTLIYRKVKFREDEGYDEDEWNQQGDRLVLECSTPIEPGGNHQFSASQPVLGKDYFELPEVVVGYLDPRAGHINVIRIASSEFKRTAFWGGWRAALRDEWRARWPWAEKNVWRG